MQPKSSAALFTALVLTCALVGPARAETRPAEKVPASPGGQVPPPQLGPSNSSLAGGVVKPPMFNSKELTAKITKAVENAVTSSLMKLDCLFRYGLESTVAAGFYVLGFFHASIHKVLDLVGLGSDARSLLNGPMIGRSSAEMKAHAAELARREDTTALLKRAARAVSQSDAGKQAHAALQELAESHGFETFLKINVFNIEYESAARAVSQSDAGKKQAESLSVKTFLSFNVFKINYESAARAVSQSDVGKMLAPSLGVETSLSFNVFNINYESAARAVSQSDVGKKLAASLGVETSLSYSVFNINIVP